MDSVWVRAAHIGRSGIYRIPHFCYFEHLCCLCLQITCKTVYALCTHSFQIHTGSLAWSRSALLHLASSVIRVSGERCHAHDDRAKCREYAYSTSSRFRNGLDVKHILRTGHTWYDGDGPSFRDIAVRVRIYSRHMQDLPHGLLNIGSLSYVFNQTRAQTLSSRVFRHLA